MRVEQSNVKFYHTGESKREDYDVKTFRRKAPKAIDKKVIAWDMEGISLSGQEKPQHAVLFGCSAEPDKPLLGERLTTREMLNYIIEIGLKYPHALHVGYAFKYDANMIIYGLSERNIIKLWRFGRVKFSMCDKYSWLIRWVPGKMFTVSRHPKLTKRNTRAKVSVTIYDYSSFFGQAFLPTAEQILREDLSTDDRDVIAHGKQARGKQDWSDMPEIEHYWNREIILIQRVFEKFRDVMHRAGFSLSQWYGPGALANYINASRGIRQHLGAVQITSGYMPREVHEASKHAFSGGRFELFKAGRIQGPIYAIDINSAYPYALTKIPSLHPDCGEWRHVVKPDRVTRFGVYRVKFKATGLAPIEYRPMPFFWRDNRGMISYPGMVHGWYWSPEAALALNIPGAEILEGWEWDSDETEFPWEFLSDMYDTRMRLGKKNLLSMPFKLGPNSLYGKYAQTVGWDQKKRLPPKSHALPVAGWVTSYCRAMLFNVVAQDPENVIAVETDSVYTTTDPHTLNIPIGDGLGEWGYDVYDELAYMQSGMYHYKMGGEWKGVRSRGINKSEYPYEVADDYLRTLLPGEQWGKMSLETKPRFIGAGAAIAASSPLKEIMTSWRSQTKEMALGDTGKRMHVHKACKQCADGTPPNECAHRLAIKSRSDGQIMSFPRRLPWERVKNFPEVEEIKERSRIENELVTG